MKDGAQIYIKNKNNQIQNCIFENTTPHIYIYNNTKNNNNNSIITDTDYYSIDLDLDYLKQINDTFGHNYGDMSIKAIGRILKKNARSIDVPARIGGEEFNVLLPGIDSKGAMIAAERIRAAIELERIEKVGQITASIGVGTYNEHTKSIDELLEITDQAMYRAKINGRNQVVLAQTPDKDNWQQIAINAFMDILSKQRIPVSKDLFIPLRFFDIRYKG